MSGDLVAEVFVRSALRFPTLIEGSALRTARRKFNSICKVLGKERKVFARFETGPDGDLLCTFGTERGLLLAETVRDWIKTEMIGEKTFLWCERLDSEYALVCIMDGQIIKETFEPLESAAAEAKRLTNRLRARAVDFSVFLHNIKPSDLKLEKDLQVRQLKRSVFEHIEQMDNPIPELLPYHQAIARVASKWRVRMILLAGVLVVTLVIPGTWMGVNWWLGELPKIDLNAIKRQQILVEEYRDLLRSPDPDILLPAIHRTSLKFLQDSSFGKRWIVKAFEWSRESGQLKILASLPKIQDKNGKTKNLPGGLQQKIRAEAEKRGWKTTLSGFDATFMLPVAAEGRPEMEADGLRMPKPEAEDDLWSLTRMTSDMKLIGVLSPADPARKEATEVYSTEPLVLEISSDPWPTGGTARWVGRRLKGGPLVLDAVVLHALPGGSGGLVNGRISFRLVWRSPK